MSTNECSDDDIDAYDDYAYSLPRLCLEGSYSLSLKGPGSAIYIYIYIYTPRAVPPAAPPGCQARATAICTTSNRDLQEDT